MRALLLVVLVSACEPPPPPPPAVCKEAGPRTWSNVCAPTEFCVRGSVLVPCANQEAIRPPGTGSTEEGCDLFNKIYNIPPQYAIRLHTGTVYNRKFVGCFQ